jgi:molybdopterin molybdotransferase
VALLPAERVALRDSAGRVLRQEVQAERDNPPFDRVCMDGVAVASSAFAGGARSFRLQGTQAAGAVPLTLAAPSDAIEVMTGAVLPPGTDAVIPLEEYDLAGDRLALKAEASAEPWRNVQRRGSDSMPGVAMLAAGMRLGAAELAVVASAGLASVEVSREPRVTVVSTGDELIEPGLPIADHQVRRSNAYAVCAALQLHGYTEVADQHLRDDEAVMRHHLGEILETRDVLVLSGGVSKGKFDFVPSALKALGVTEVINQVAQRPGRPMWFGIGLQNQLVFGLPGNPVSTLLCLIRYVLPALAVATGQSLREPERLAVSEAMSGRKMTYFMPVTLVNRGGATLGEPHAPQGSGDFLALAGTDGFVELPPRPEGYPAGFVADFFRW